MLASHTSKRFLLSLPFLAIAASACGPSQDEFEARGTISRVKGEVVVLSEDEAATVCESQYCEPNYVYSASFGSPRRRPPVTPPPGPIFPPYPQPPRPTPPPVSNPTVPPNQEYLDYSRQMLGMERAWEITTGSQDIIVAVVDTGVAVTHQDLRNNIWVNEAERSGRPGVDDDGNGYTDDVYGYDFVNNRPNGIDDQKHGTHCAGIIGAEKNGMGTLGVSQKVRIMPLKFLDSSGSGDTAAAIKAIDYAVKMGAHVISNSWGGGGASQLLDESIQKAISRGILVVAAAGNETNNNDARPSYPAAYSGVIAVASTDESDQMSSFSNYGRNSVMVAAPGSRIYSTVLGGAYDFLSGTSMAAPQVSGALALALSVNPGISASDLKSMLCSTSKKSLLDRVKCGRMDVGSFISAVSQN